MSKHSLSHLLKLQNSTFIVCEVTGIPLSISFPNCGIDFNYKSPFTKYNNILKVATLSPEKIRALPKVTLAGITLAILSHHNLLNRYDVSAVEANVYFQLLPSHLLISVIKFFTASISSSTIEILPHFSLDSIQDKAEFSTRENLLENYIKACREIINPTPSNQVNIISSSPISGSSTWKKVEIKSLTPELRKEAKDILSELNKDFLMSPKLSSILKIVVQKDNLITLGDEMRAKIISRLEPMETSASKRMISILLSCQKNANHAEIIKKNIIEEDMSRLSDTFDIVTKRKSLAEILKDKMNSRGEAVGRKD